MSYNTPVEGQIIVTSDIGERDTGNPETSVNHLGIDIDLAIGDNVNSVDDGEIIYVGDNVSGYGNVVVVGYGKVETKQTMINDTTESFLTYTNQSNGLSAE